MRVVILLSLLFFLSEANSQHVYELKDPTASHPLYSYLTYLPDSPGLTFEKVIDQHFTTFDSIASKYKDNRAYWIRAEIKNETSFSQFVVTTDLWSEALVFFKEKDTWKNLVSGTHVAVNQRPLSLHRLLSFPLPLKQNESSVIYFHVKYSQPLLGYFVNLYSFTSKVEIDEASHAYKKYIGVQLLVMFIVGVLTILFFYHLILFFFNKETASLILSCYLFVSALAIANSNGIATNYFFTQVNSFELVLGMLLGHAIPIIMALFLVVFLKLTSEDWEFSLLFAFTAVVMTSMVVSFFVHIQLLYVIRRYVVYLSFIVVVGTSIVKKRPGAATLMVALLFTVTTSYFAELKSVFFKNISFTGPDKPYLIGVLVQMLILSGAATYRVRVLQQGVQAMREEQRQFIQKQNDQLRIQVDKKTLQLRSALLRLEQKKNQLESANQDLSEKSASIQELNEKLEHLISERTEALQSTMRDLDTFLYRTSHDLRRPLMTILGLINVAKKEGNLKKTHEILGHVTKTVDDLDRMLSKLIAISFCYGDKLPKAPVDLFFMAAESIASVTRAYALQSNQIQLTTIGDSGTFSSNVYLLKVMLFSILENAVQYGGETVKIKVIAEVNQNTAVLSVIDNGPGIDSLYQELVFDMFFRGHEKSAGNGLGLYLVKIGVEKLGGSVKLQSSPGNGTEVRLSFS